MNELCNIDSYILSFEGRLGRIRLQPLYL